MFDTYLYHFITIAVIVGVTSISVGIGEGLTGVAALQALITQPRARLEISKTFLLGMALIETAGVLGLTMSILLFNPSARMPLSEYGYYAELGILFAVGISGMVLGIVSSYPARAACHAVARQPFFAQKIQIMMLLTQSIMQTPLIFAFMISILIKMQLVTSMHAADAMRLIAAGLCIGVGSIGPTIGLALIAQQACTSLGMNKYAYNTLLPFTLISQAIVESPLVFSLIVSLSILFTKVADPSLLISGIAFLSAGLCMGVGTGMPGISSGKTAAQACASIAYNPTAASTIFKVSLISQVLLETGSIYALLVSFIIILMQ